MKLIKKKNEVSFETKIAICYITPTNIHNITYIGAYFNDYII